MESPFGFLGYQQFVGLVTSTMNRQSQDRGGVWSPVSGCGCGHPEEPLSEPTPRSEQRDGLEDGFR